MKLVLAIVFVVLVMFGALAGAVTLASVNHDLYNEEVIGDDNNDGTIQEDESGWNCVTMGNKVCG